MLKGWSLCLGRLFVALLIKGSWGFNILRLSIKLIPFVFIGIWLTQIFNEPFFFELEFYAIFLMFLIMWSRVFDLAFEIVLMLFGITLSDRLGMVPLLIFGLIKENNFFCHGGLDKRK